MNLDSLNLTVIWDTVLTWSPKIIAGILVLIIGFWVVKLISNIITRSLQKADVDSDLIPFLKSLISVLLKILVVLTAAGVVGIEITAFAALLAGAGLAIGAAMSGTLGHFASGVMVLLFKPYKVGDLVKLDDTLGTVEQIEVFNTILQTPDNKKVILPNGLATSGKMINLSSFDKIRVDLKVGVPYEEPFEKIQKIILTALQEVPNILDVEPTVEISSFAESSVILDVMPYATDKTYWDVYYGSYKSIKNALAAAGVRVPYPVELEKPY